MGMLLDVHQHIALSTDNIMTRPLQPAQDCEKPYPPQHFCSYLSTGSSGGQGCCHVSC